MFNDAVLVGQDENFISQDGMEVPLHLDVLPEVKLLKQCAADEGFELAIASGYRSFERQRIIWNAKAQGQRAVLDAYGRPIDITELNEVERVFAILRWSALPGASRHHWGTDFDIYDGQVVRDGYELALTVKETEPGGAFEELYAWLDKELECSRMSFYRPYKSDLGGVSPEPWHLSYFPLAKKYEKKMSVELIASVIAGAEVMFKKEILENLEEIYERYIMNVCAPS